MAMRLNRDSVPGVIGTPKAFIVHHTGGGGDVQGVIDTLNQRHLGVQYIMDRDGRVYQVGGPGESQMMPGWGKFGSGLSNANTVGMEVIAKDDSDLTPAQIAAAQQFIKSTYPGIPVYGHGQVNPGHKQETEGMTIVNAIQGMQQQGYTPEQIKAAFLSSIAQGESPGYDVMFGGQKFSDFSRHPHQTQTAGGISSDAAGRYQFLGSTWDELAGKYGYKDFSQANQDAAAWQYAGDIYKAKTNGSLEEALKSGDPARINAAAQILNQTWTSLPGGKEQSKGYGGKTFADIYSGYLGKPSEVAAAAPSADKSQPGAAAPTNQFALPQTEKERPKHWLEVFGDSMQNAASGPLPKVQMDSRQPAGPAITADQPIAPVAPLATQDPARRQQLAQLLAQLNAGKLTL